MTILTVGSGQQFARLADAIAASRDGDVIRAQAGTYVNDFATISTRITIEGVGGMVNLVATQDAPNGKAILTTTTDVTLDHVALSGATASAGNGAGIRHENGALTLSNVYIHHNQNGILAGANPNSSITIANSEFAFNGTGTGQTHGLYANEIGSLTIRDSYFHDVSVGHEIKSRAFNTLIESSRIMSGPNGTDSYAIDMPNGGAAVLRNNVIVEGPRSQNPNTIHYGGEAGPHPGSSLLISGNTFVNDRGGNANLLLNQTGVTSTFSDNRTFGYRSDQIAQGGPINISGSIALSSRPLVDTSAISFGAINLPAPAPTPTPAPAPAPTPTPAPSSGPDTLVVNLSEDAYGGNAQFVVSLDGVELGGAQEVTALHSQGQSQAFTFRGTFGSGAHTVGVRFLNDAYGGTPSTDRNLYVDGISLNGTPYPNTTATLLSAGLATLNLAASAPAAVVTPPPAPVPVPSSGPDTLVLQLSGDAYLGYAQFIASVDGVELGGAQEVTALHRDGQSQAFTFRGAFGSGAHTVGVRFVNDAHIPGSATQDRNLYVDGISLNGTPVPNAKATLLSAGLANFGVSAAAPSPATTSKASSIPAVPPGSYALEGPKWASNTITWAYADKTYAQDASNPFSSPIGGGYQATIQQAMDTWASVSGLTFRQVADTPDANGAAAIRIGFADLNAPATNVVGATSYRYSIGGSSQVFLPDVVVRLQDPNQVPLVSGANGLQYQGFSTTLYQVALHEVGHALGLGHSNDATSIMYPSLGSQDPTLNASDVAGIQALYGASSGAQLATGNAPGTPSALASSSSEAMVFHEEKGSYVSIDGREFGSALTAEDYDALGLSGSMAFSARPSAESWSAHPELGASLAADMASSPWQDNAPHGSLPGSEGAHAHHDHEPVAVNGIVTLTDYTTGQVLPVLQAA